MSGLLGFSFGFGAKDVGMRAAMDNGLAAMEKINDVIRTQDKILKSSRISNFFEGLQAIDLGGLVSKLGDAGEQGVGQLTNSMESFAIQASKTAAPMLTQIGLTGEAFKKAKSTISGVAYGLNMDAGTVTKAFIAMDQAGQATKDTLKSMGLDLKNLSKLQEATGVDAQVLVDNIDDLTKSWGFSADQAKGLMDAMAKTAMEGKVGTVAFGKFRDIMGTVDKVLAVSGIERTPETIASLNQQVVQLAGVMRRTGADAEGAMTGALGVMEQMLQHSVDIEKLQVGNVDEYGPLVKSLFEVGGALGMTGDHAIDFAQTLVKAGPLDASRMLQEQFMALQKTGNKPAMDRFRQSLEPLGSDFLFMVTNVKEGPKAFAEMAKAGDNAAGTMAKMAKQGYESGITLDESLSRMEDAFDSRLKGIIRGPIRDFVRNRGQAFRSLAGEIKEASKDATWGPLVTKLVEIRTLGWRALFPQTQLGLKMQMAAEGAVKLAKELAPVVMLLNSVLGPVVRAVTGGFEKLGGLVGFVASVPFTALGGAVAMAGRGLQMVGGVVRLVGAGIEVLGASISSLGAPLEDMGDFMMNNLAPGIHRVTNRLQGMIEGVGDFLGAIPLVGGALGIVFDGLSMIVGIAGHTTGALVKLAGAGVKALGKAMPFIGGAVQLAGRGVGLLGEAARKSGEALEKVGRGVMEAGGKIQKMGPGFMKTIGMMSLMVLGAGQAGDGLSKQWATIEKVLKPALIKITDWIRGIDFRAAGQKLVKFFAELPAKIADGLNEARKPIGDRLEASTGSLFVDLLAGIGGAIGGFVSGMWNEFKKQIGAGEESGGSIIGTALKKVFELALDAAFALGDVIGPHLDKAIAMVSSPEFRDQMSEAFTFDTEEAGATATDAAKTSMDKFDSAMGKAKTMGMADKLLGVFKTIGKGLAAALIGGVQVFLGFIDKALFGAGKDVVQRFKEGAGLAEKRAKKLAGGAPGEVLAGEQGTGTLKVQSDLLGATGRFVQEVMKEGPIDAFTAWMRGELNQYTFSIANEGVGGVSRITKEGFAALQREAEAGILATYQGSSKKQAEMLSMVRDAAQNLADPALTRPLEERLQVFAGNEKMMNRLASAMNQLGDLPTDDVSDFIDVLGEPATRALTRLVAGVGGAGDALAELDPPQREAVRRAMDWIAKQELMTAATIRTGESQQQLMDRLRAESEQMASAKGAVAAFGAGLSQLGVTQDKLKPLQDVLALQTTDLTAAKDTLRSFLKSMADEGKVGSDQLAQVVAGMEPKAREAFVGMLQSIGTTGRSGVATVSMGYAEAANAVLAGLDKVDAEAAAKAQSARDKLASMTQFVATEGARVTGMLTSELFTGDKKAQRSFMQALAGEGVSMEAFQAARGPMEALLENMRKIGLAEGITVEDMLATSKGDPAKLQAMVGSMASVYMEALNAALAGGGQAGATLALSEDRIKQLNESLAPLFESGITATDLFGQGWKEGQSGVDATVEMGLNQLMELFPQSEPKRGPLQGMTERGLKLTELFGKGLHEGMANVDVALRIQMGLMGAGAIDAFVVAADAAAKARTPDLLSALKTKALNAMRVFATGDPQITQKAEIAASATGIPDVVTAIYAAGAEQVAILKEIKKDTERMAAVKEAAPADGKKLGG